MPQVSDMVPSNYLKVSDLTVDDRYEERDVTIVSCERQNRHSRQSLPRTRVLSVLSVVS